MTIRHDPDDTETMTRGQWVALTVGAPVAMPDNARLADRLTVAIESTRKGWHRLANCRGVDPALFFPAKGDPTSSAKQVCAGCVVREDCLAHAMAANEKYGIWGGLSTRERLQIRRRRAREARETAA
jgi:WhiB family redox-sensing transcriptional regulator